MPADDAIVRRFLTTLFTLRAHRHLETLAVAYGWSPEELAYNKSVLIEPHRFVPAASANVIQEK